MMKKKQDWFEEERRNLMGNRNKSRMEKYIENTGEKKAVYGYRKKRGKCIWNKICKVWKNI